MSDKPRVYQGVRVKTTVKELLQRHRAREANSKKVKTISQTCLDLQELCAATLPADARAFQLQCTNSFSFPDGSCSLQMQESPFHDIQQQFGDLPLPGSGYTGHHNNHSNNNNTNNNHTGDGGCSYSSASLPPPPSLPLPWCHGLSSDADYYGHGMAPCSPPGSLKLCHPNMDANSYSPQDSFSSSSSSCYDSPTRLCESSSYHHQPHHHGSLASVDSHYNHYQHCSLQDCYCLPHCWPTAAAQQESLSSGPELYAPYYNNPCTDYSYTCATEESTFRRDLQMSSEMCYNVL